MSEFLVHTGSIIKEYLDENHINQKDFALRTGVSEKHISNLLNGKSRLTEEMALKLEKLIPTMPASYWLNYESKYREYLARQAEENAISQTELQTIARRFKFNEIFGKCDIPLVEQAISVLKLLKISDFCYFEKAYANLEASFMEDGGELEPIAIWLRLCEEDIPLQNGSLDEIPYSKEKLLRQLGQFKLLALNSNLDYALVSCCKLCNSLGIYLVIREAITNSKVRGALTTINGHPAIFLSLRYRSPAYVWFALMHEIGHLLLHYDLKATSISCDTDNNKSHISKQENEANKFARDALIDKCAFDDFVSKCIFTEATIRTFAQKQGVLPEIVVVRLQHDGIIGYNEFAYLK